ncbi:MAG: hypothetical protein ACREC5_02820 [Thermoplasmata archaeon]
MVVFYCDECEEAAEKAGTDPGTAEFDSLNAALTHILSTGHTVAPRLEAGEGG